MSAGPLKVEIGAGCSATLRWFDPESAVITVLNPDGRWVRKIPVSWTRAAILRADSQVRNIVTLAVATGRTPPMPRGA